MELIYESIIISEKTSDEYFHFKNLIKSMYGEFIKQSMQSLGRELLSAMNYSVQEINLERLLMLK